MFALFLNFINSDDEAVINNSLKNKNTSKSNVSLLSNGFLFGFLKDEEKVYVVPNELLEILDNYLQIENDCEYVDDIDDYIYEYITANGVIEREKLQELLFNHHGIKVNLEELDKLVKKEQFTIKDNLYIVFNDFSKDEIEIVQNLKDAFKLGYKVCDYNVALPENNMIEELEDFLDGINIHNSLDVVSIIVSGIKIGVITESDLKDQLLWKVA